MKTEPTLDEIQAMMDRGEEPPPEILADSGQRAGKMLAILMGVPPVRVRFEFIPLPGIPGKVGASVSFDPELTDAEQPLYEAAMHMLCRLTGSRPPTKAPRA